MQNVSTKIFVLNIVKRTIKIDFLARTCFLQVCLEKYNARKHILEADYLSKKNKRWSRATEEKFHCNNFGISQDLWW